MPVRSLNSAVLRWPDRQQVLSAARRWARSLRRQDHEVEAILCVGSYARGDWGVGSDLDVIVVVQRADDSAVARRARYEPSLEIPGPVDIWIYTQSEWQALAENWPGLRQRLQNETLDLISTG